MIMKYQKRSAILCTAMLMLLSGCMSDPERPTYTEDELPYGATMRENKTSYAVPMTYDRRFIEEAQVEAVANALGSIQNQDADKYESMTPAYYTAYLKEVYGCGETDALLAELHTYIAASSGEDFQFNMVLINGVSTNRNAGGLADAFTLLEGIYDGEGSFSDSIVNAWDFTVEWDLSYDEGKQFSVVEEAHIYLFQTADSYFCVM